MDAQQRRFHRTYRPVVSPYGSTKNTQNYGNPVISNISSGTPGANQATITWTTNIKADSQVFWGLTTAYGGASSPIMQDTAPYVTSHSVTITGLTTLTTYHYKILTRSPGGTYTFSADQTFVTA